MTGTTQNEIIELLDRPAWLKMTKQLIWAFSRNLTRNAIECSLRRRIKRNLVIVDKTKRPHTYSLPRKVG